MKMTKIELASVELSGTSASISAKVNDKSAAKLRKVANAGGLSSLTLLVAACGGGSSDTSAPQSTLLTLTKSGDTYSASSVTGFALTDSSSAKFDVTDDTSDNAYSITLTASGTGTLEFDFADADDTVTLDSSSTVTGFTTLKITDGTVDATAADLSSITRVEVASGAILSLAQVKEIPTLVVNDAVLGKITVEVATVAEADELVSLLTAGTVSVYGTSSNIEVVASSTADDALTTEVIATKQTAVVAEVKAVSEAPADSGSDDASGESGSDDESGSGDESGSSGDSGSGSGSAGGGGGGGSSSSDVLSLTLVTTGNYQLGSDNGAVTLTESGSQLILTPATGGGTTVTKASVNSLATSVDITATAAVASGMTVTGTGGFAVTALDATAAADLSNITVTGARTAAVSDDVTFTGNLGTFTTTVAAGKTLTGDVAKLQGETINGAGTVAVTDLNTDLDADLSTITATTVTATFNDSGTFTGNLGTATTTVAATKTMTAAASVVNAEKIAGTGNLTITGVTNATDVSNFTLTGTYTVSGVTTAANLNALDTLSGTAVVATGITSLAGTAADLQTVLTNHAAGTTLIDADYTVTTTGTTTATAATLIALDTDTSGVVTATDVTGITGTAADLQSVLTNHAAGTTDIDADYTVTVSAGTATANTLDALNTDTSGSVDISAVTSITLADGNDTFNVSAAGLVEGAGAFTITGGTGNDTITGGDNIDTIVGGVGNDILSGGTGADTFVRSGDATTDGVDTVTFVVSDDIIDFTTSASLENGVATTAYGEGALGAIGTGVGLQVFGSNITVADATAGPTEAEIETFLDTTEVFFNGATSDAVYIFADNGVNTYGFLVQEGADGVDKQFDAADDIGTTFIILSGLADATTLSAANFADFA